jgi:hypothetical protein
MSVIPYSVRDRKININEVNGVDLVSALDNELLMKNSLDQIEGGHLTSVSTSIFGTDTNYLNIYSSDDTTPITSIQSETDGTDYKLHLYPKSVITNPSQSAMTIINNPSNNEVRVGINLTDPEETLEVDGSIQIDSNLVARLKFQKSGMSTHALGEIDGELDGNNGGDLQFYTKVDGGSVTEKLRINNVGAIGIGGANFGTAGQVLKSNGENTAVSWDAAYTTSTAPASGEDALLTSGTIHDTVSRDIRVYATGSEFRSASANHRLGVENSSCYMVAGLYTLQAFTNGIKIAAPQYTSYREVLVTGGFSPSDDRLKFNERDIPNGLEVINKLNPQVYEFAVGGLDCIDRQTEAGFIAQDVEKIAEISYASRPPRGHGEDYYHLHYQTLFTYAVKAIQELSARVTTLEQRVN